MYTDLRFSFDQFNYFKNGYPVKSAIPIEKHDGNCRSFVLTENTKLFALLVSSASCTGHCMDGGQWKIQDSHDSFRACCWSIFLTQLYTYVF